MPAEPGAEEPSVEAVAGAYCIDGIDEYGGDPVSLDAAGSAVLDERSTGSAFDYDEGDAGGQGVKSLVECSLAGYLFDLLFVGEEQVDFVEQDREDAGPVAGGIVIGIEREGQAGVVQVVEEDGKAGVQAGLEEKGGEMEVTGGGEVGEIQIGDRHLGHDAWVGEDVALAAMRKEDGDSGAGASFTGDVGGVESGFGEACAGDVAHLVGSYL